MSAKSYMKSVQKFQKKKRDLSQSWTQNLHDSACNKRAPTTHPTNLHKNTSLRIYITISEWFQHSVLDHTLISGPQYNSTKLQLNLGKWLGGRLRPPFILIYKQYNLFLDNELNIATIQQKSNYCCYPNSPSLYYPNRELGPAYGGTCFMLGGLSTPSMHSRCTQIWWVGLNISFPILIKPYFLSQMPRP